MLPIKTILHPTDFSELSDAAFRVACSLAQDHGARLVVAHVYPPPATHGELVARRQDDDFEKELRRVLERVRPENPAIPVEHILEEGHAAETILRLAKERGCDLIVMGTHGRTGVRRLLLGSVAEQVVRQAPCPVLTLNAPFPRPA